MEKYVLRTVEDMEKFFLSFGSIFSFDIETTSEEIEKFRKTYGYKKKLPDNIDKQALNYYYILIEGISFCNGKVAAYIPLNPMGDTKKWELLKKVFGVATTLIGHNIAFDLKGLKKYGINCEGKKIYCTMVADHLLNEEREHGLKKLAKEQLHKNETIGWEEAREKGGEVFENYAINDAIWTWELMEYQQPLMKQEGVVDLFRNIEMPFQHCIVEMESNGVLVDMKKHTKLYEKCKKELDSLTMQMLDLIGKKASMQVSFDGDVNIISPVNFDSNPQLCEILFNKRGLKPIEQTPGGKQSVGKTTLLKYKDKDEFVGLLFKYKIMQKLISGFLEPLPNFVCGDNKVRPHFRDTGTKTGRLASSGPNYQQIPRNNKETGINIRDLFIADKDYDMMAIDYSGQEVRVAAEVSQDPTFIDALNKGLDMHLTVANKSFNLGIPEECLMETHPEFETYKNKFKHERTMAKSITFGLLYGKSSIGFAFDFGITEQEAQQMIDNYFNGMPKVRESIDKAHKDVYNNGCVTFLSGRKRRFQKVQKNGWEGYTQRSLRQAYNAIIQGSSSDMMRMAMNGVQKFARENPKYDIKTIATVHDEAIYLFKEEYKNEVPKKIKEIFENVLKFSVPIIAEYSVGKSYGECK